MSIVIRQSLRLYNGFEKLLANYVLWRLILLVCGCDFYSYNFISSFCILCVTHLVSSNSVFIGYSTLKRLGKLVEYQYVPTWLALMVEYWPTRSRLSQGLKYMFILTIDFTGLYDAWFLVISRLACIFKFNSKGIKNNF